MKKNRSECKLRAAVEAWQVTAGTVAGLSWVVLMADKASWWHCFQYNLAEMAAGTYDPDFEEVPL